MVATGVRISELVQIQIEDIRRGQMDLYSKRQQDPTYLFPPQCTGDLSDVAAKRKQVQRQSVFEPFRKSDHTKGSGIS